MTSATDQKQDPPVEEASWRGVAADGQEVTEHVSGMLQARSRRLLGELIRPHRRWVWVLIAIVLVENAARLSIPYLVKEGIDKGIPPIRESGDTTVLYTVVGIALFATLLQAVTRRTFLVLAGRIGQDILFEIRRRVFRHFQRLSPSFHDDYTSGRVISRQTSDIDALDEMLETGFDGLVTAVLTLAGTAVLLLVLDVKLALVALLCFPFLLWLTNWFRKASSATYRVTREKVALVIVHFVESMLGIRAVQAFRREPRNTEIFDDVNDRLGHQAGDELIQRVADELVRSFADLSACVVGRVGGDEFTVLSVDLSTDPLVELTNQVIARSWEADPETALSGGIASAVLTSDRDLTPSDVFVAADRALYVAKRERRRTAFVTGPL